MFEAVQDLRNKNVASKKLQFVKLIFIAITLGFTLTVTFLVSDEKNTLSMLENSLKAGLSVMSRSRICQNDVRYNLSSGLYIFPCKINSTTYLALEHSDTMLFLNREQWKNFKLKIIDLNEFFVQN